MPRRYVRFSFSDCSRPADTRLGKSAPVRANSGYRDGVEKLVAGSDVEMSVARSIATVKRVRILCDLFEL